MDNNLEKAVKPEVSKESMLEVIKELQEIIVGMIEIEEPEAETETENGGESENSGEMMPGMMEAMGKMEGQTDLEVEEENGTYSTKSWGGVFSPLNFKKF